MNPPRTFRSSRNLNDRMSRQIKGGLTVAALVLVPLLAVAAGDAFRAALDFTTGVLSLLSLTAAVAWGLIATDRLLLSPRHRLLAQGVHRATAVASLGFLVLHVTVKVTLGHVALIGALVPFGLGVSGTDGLIGLGSLAGLLMIVAATTGALRSAFAVPGRIAGRWRATHMLAYPAWCFALMHGLYAGRAPATWVTTMYCLSLVGVASAVSLRLLPRPLQRRVADRIAVLTGAVRETPAAERTRRDPSADPLPGATGPAPETEYDQWLQREPAMSARTTARRLGGPRTPPRLAAPAPPLYEAARPAADTFPGTFTGTGTGTGRPDDPDTGPFPGAGADPVPGPGIAAGYRAVSLAGDPGNDRTARIPVTPPPTGEIPLAERIPMTEELPVVSNEPTGRPGSWPAPSPPVPAQAFAPPAPPLYDSGAVPPYDSGATPAYDTGALPPRHATTSPYDTGAVPVQDGRTPASAPPSPSGPLYPPPAGEPWHAPAGDRP